MSHSAHIQIVDLFAGPGGLGEGFSSYNDGKSFEIKVSAEMDPAARATLRLRAFYRFLKKNQPEALGDYYDFCETASLDKPYTERSLDAWKHADGEAQLIELGSEEGNARLDRILEERLDESKPWVLIGGPPCQAYSVVGRARNRGKLDYRAEDDHRHFLYREYLRIIQRKKPAIFVMENVKGILSSKVGGERMFPKILSDLTAPDVALGEQDSGRRYRICSLVDDDVYESGASPNSIDPNHYIIRAEEFGIPQARHRVILLGVAEEFFDPDEDHKLTLGSKRVTVKEVIGTLPPLRSTLTKSLDTSYAWADTVKAQLQDMHAELKSTSSICDKNSILFSERIGILARSFSNLFDGEELHPGGLRVLKREKWTGITGTYLDEWYQDPRLRYWLNHEARGHMASDLRRYVYASQFADAHYKSPKGHGDFNLAGLAPNHKNWETGKFSDRFRVQMHHLPSTTITSHIAKDGHYFIHYDSRQCRSLTVREAARLQTFPDNYFFLGNRTEQFHQVGNAVPPMLARQIAEIVARIIGSGTKAKRSRLMPRIQERLFEA
ncbi:DNA (cytosine-5)-methyltransferase 1 [Pseudomonas cedrina]|uniref:DNA (cytosine-5-)-methyltransferase n=1 Tax=Pseudomonas cedrina TaxID=651740 RepID=A0ABY0UWQ5_PSECE|nr:DNA cytosine methyltransferase [Pseudomonas cedrina]SDT30370.1 DNA (cytosine-5)-methyltransferase 1 [Pseudomonas cedrina]